MAKVQGTTVPNSGYVEKVYFNTSLSIEEVVSLLSQLTLNEEGIREHFLMGKTDVNLNIWCMTQEGMWGISDEKGSFYFVSADIGLGFAGWNPNITYPLAINSEVISEINGVSIGTQNHLLSNLFSITPFTQSTIADKLQILIDGKQYVIDKTNNKANTDLQLNCTWEELGDTIDGISGGVDTSDSTASASDIRIGKTAYIGTGKVEGTIEDYDGSYEGDGEEAVNTLKKLLDHTQTTANMFYGNSTTSDFNGYIQYDDTENVIDMSYMFHSCVEIETLPLFNTKNATKINGMFYNCSKLITIPNFDFSKVQTMNTLFSGCNNLKTVSLPNTSSAYNMASVFNNCKSLETITELNTQSAEDMSYMFNNCYELVNFPRLNTKKNTNFKSMFLNCDVLEKIDISYFKCASTNSSDSMFYNCASLKKLIIREFGPYYVINTNTFSNCFHILGKTNAISNPEGLKDGYIYVPRNMIESLSNETNWSAYASQLRALEDYTIDGTTTGELDESKVSL